MRGRLVPPDGKLARTRAELFDDLVLDAVEHFEEQVGDQLAGVVFVVEDVPPELPSYDPNVIEDGDVPLSRLLPAADIGRGQPESPRIVLYRRPLEVRAIDREDLADLVHDIVLEQIANLLGVDPDVIEPE
jgi:predicted Zn-dependent protease with MMP-like domain